MATKFLDSNGLLYVWGKIKSLVNGAYIKPATGIPASDLAQAVQDILNSVPGKYIKPVGGIPVADLAQSIQDAIASATTALQADSPAMIGTPTAPTAAAGTNTTQVATTAFVMNAVASAMMGSFVAVDTLPTASADTMGKIYLVPSASATSGNVKDEYITVETSANTYAWELIGTTQLDLSNYWSKSDLEAITNAEIDTICT